MGNQFNYNNPQSSNAEWTNWWNESLKKKYLVIQFNNTTVLSKT